MTYQFFYKSFLLESRFKRFENRDLKTFLTKYLNVPNAMFSFRDKLESTNYPSGINPGIGINPRNVYNTPTGIYGYPLEEIFYELQTDSIPFASSRPIVVVYKPKPNVPIVRTSSFSEKDFWDKIENVKKVFNANSEEVQEVINNLDIRYSKNLAQILWGVVRELSQRNVNRWAKAMVDIDVPVFIDDSKSGTIHRSEPTQSVVFGKNFVEIIGVYEAPCNPSSLSNLNNFSQDFSNILNSLIKSIIKNPESFLDEKDSKKLYNKIHNLLSHIDSFNNSERIIIARHVIRRVSYHSENLDKNLLQKMENLCEELLKKIFPEKFSSAIEIKVVSLEILKEFEDSSFIPLVQKSISVLFSIIKNSLNNNSLLLWNFLVVNNFDLEIFADYLEGRDSKKELIELIYKNQKNLDNQILNFSYYSRIELINKIEREGVDPRGFDSKLKSFPEFFSFCKDYSKVYKSVFEDFYLLICRLFGKDYFRFKHFGVSKLYKSLNLLANTLKEKDPKLLEDLEKEETALSFQQKVANSAWDEDDKSTVYLINSFVKNAPMSSLAKLYGITQTIKYKYSPVSRFVNVTNLLNIADELENRVEKENYPEEKLLENSWYNMLNSPMYHFFENYLIGEFSKEELSKMFNTNSLIKFLKRQSTVEISFITENGIYEYVYLLNNSKQFLKELRRNLPEKIWLGYKADGEKIYSRLLPFLILEKIEELENVKF